jgi:transglutaminase-like putative cysteine protease
MNLPFKVSRRTAALLTAFVLGCSVLLYLLFASRPAGIPASVTIGDGLSKSDAQALYDFSNTMLRGFYWKRALSDLKIGQFRRAWAGMKSGPEKITALAKKADGRFSVHATNHIGGFSVEMSFTRIPVSGPVASFGPPTLLAQLQSDRTFTRNAGTVFRRAGHPAREDTYTITSVLQVLKPADPADMNDDFQEARVLAQDNDSYTVEVTYYPLHRQVIGENPNWREEDAGMTQYLRPTATENWDETMQRDLVAELRSAGIDPDHLTDKRLVEQVSQWAMRRAHSTEAFSIWAVAYPDGKPTVFPPLREAFERQKPEKTWTDEQMFDQEVLGRSMFYNKVHGSCTSASVYLATILRALGVPTRIVFCIPPFDSNDDGQARMFYDNVQHNQVRETVRAALDGTGGFENHLFNEVYVGHRWVRLNYRTLGQPILDSRYFGLLTHIYTCSDLSQVPLAQTWGMRFFKYPADQPKLSSVNPYRLISVRDHFGARAEINNPPVEPAELRTVTIIGLYLPDSPQVPKRAADALALKRTETDFLIAYKEWVPGSYNQMRAFQKRASQDFLLIAAEKAEVRVHLSDLRKSAGDGSFQAYGAHILPEDKGKLVPGTAYGIQPINTNETYRWTVAPGLTFSPVQN